MKFCDADACPSCSLNGNVPDCLRHKAQFCFAWARTASAGGARAALEKLGALLLQEAAMLERETAARAGIEHAVGNADPDNADRDFSKVAA